MLPRSRGAYHWHLLPGNPDDLDPVAVVVWEMLAYCVLRKEPNPAGIKGWLPYWFGRWDPLLTARMGWGSSKERTQETKDRGVRRKARAWKRPHDKYGSDAAYEQKNLTSSQTLTALRLTYDPRRFSAHKPTAKVHTHTHLPPNNLKRGFHVKAFKTETPPTHLVVIITIKTWKSCLQKGLLRKVLSRLRTEV